MSDKKFTIHVPFECSLIECENKECGMKFILHAIISQVEKHEYDHDNMIMPQSAVYYCPYCGEKQAVNRGK